MTDVEAYGGSREVVLLTVASVAKCIATATEKVCGAEFEVT